MVSNISVPTYTIQHSGGKNSWQDGEIITANSLNKMQKQIKKNTDGFSNVVQYSNTQPTNEYNQVWIKEDKEQNERTVRLAEMDDFDDFTNNVIVVSQEKPDNKTNKLWVHTGSDTEVQIPTYDEFTEAKSKISEIINNLNAVKYELEVGYNKNVTPALENGCYSGEVGTVIDDSNTDAYWRRCGITVSAGESYKVTIRTYNYSTPLIYIWLCDENDVIKSITHIDKRAVELVDEVVTIESGISKMYIRAYNRYSTGQSITVMRLSSPMRELQDAIPDIDFTRYKEIKNIKFAQKAYINWQTGGSIVASSTVVSSSFPVRLPENTTKIIYSKRYLTSLGASGMSFGDENRQYCGGEPEGLSSTGSIIVKPCVVDVPANAKYARFTYFTTPAPDYPEFYLYAYTNGALKYLNADVSWLKNGTNVSGITVHVYDFWTSEKSDDATIEQAMSFVSGFDDVHKTIVFDSKDWVISKAILLQSNTTVVIDGVTIKQADYTFDNVFRGDNLTFDINYPNGFATAYTQLHDISIVGKNGAQIIGPDINQTYTHPNRGEVTMTGDNFGWRTHQISLSAATNVTISGISFTKTRGWCISFDFCNNVTVYDLYINSTDNNITNGDGIDFRVGCHDIYVHDISGYTQDDTVACTALYSVANNESYPIDNYLFPSEPLGGFKQEIGVANCSIYNVRIDNILAGGSNHNVICLCNGGAQVYDVFINGIEDQFPSDKISIVKVYEGYGSGYTSGDLHDIRINAVRSFGAKYAFECNTHVTNVWANKLIQKRTGSGVALTKITYQNGITITNS